MSISSICPVCNGLEEFKGACPGCGAPAEDGGRLNDCYGPYSPYRPIDDVRLTNGYPDLEERICLHAARCGRCGASFVAYVPEIGMV